MGLLDYLFGKKDNKSNKREEKKEQSTDYVARDFLHDLNDLIAYTVRTEKLEKSKEKYLEALKLVKPEYRCNFDLFLETGEANQTFADYLYTDENAQKAVKSVFSIEETQFNNFKENIERGGIPKEVYDAAFALVEPKYQSDFKKFISTGESSSPEFLKYFDTDNNVQMAANMIMEEQGKKLEDVGRFLRGEISLDDKVN